MSGQANTIAFDAAKTRKYSSFLDDFTGKHVLLIDFETYLNGVRSIPEKISTVK
jgi:hypothetical protein